MIQLMQIIASVLTAKASWEMTGTRCVLILHMGAAVWMQWMYIARALSAIASQTATNSPHNWLAKVPCSTGALIQLA